MPAEMTSTTSPDTYIYTSPAALAYSEFFDKELTQGNRLVTTPEVGLPRFMSIKGKMEDLLTYLYGSSNNASNSYKKICADFTEHNINTDLAWHGVKYHYGLGNVITNIIFGSLTMVPNRFHQDDYYPNVKLVNKADEINGSPENGSICSVLEFSSEVVRHWPFMSKLYDAGHFGIFSAKVLISLAQIRDRLAMKEPALLGVERNCLLLTLQLLISYLPYRLGPLVAIHIPVLNKSLDIDYKFAGYTWRDVTPEFDIWDSAPDELLKVSECLFLNSSNISYDRIGRTIVAANQIGNTLAATVNKRMFGEVLPLFKYAYESLTDATITFEFEAPPAWMGSILKPQEPLHFNFNAIADINNAASLVKQLCDHIDASIDVDDLKDDLAMSKKRTDEINAIHDQIQLVVAARTIDSLNKITELAEQVKVLANANKAHNQALLTLLQTHFDTVHDFIGQLNSLSKSHITPEPPCPVATLTATGHSAPNLDGPSQEARISELEHKYLESEDRLSTAHADIKHLSQELAEKRCELHKLRAITQANPIQGFPAPAVQVIDPSLINRIVLRSNLSATDVLDYFGAIAPERVTILKSAYVSAAENSGHGPTIERMLDLMHKAIFPYLDAINSGTADSEARKLFGSKAYSAMESKTTRSNGRLASLRDFEYQGKTIRMIRHLRINNATGKEGMRLYFEIIESRIVIGYAGEHLEVASS